MKCEKILANEISRVVDIHCQAFPSFFLTSLGPQFLREYYSIVIREHFGQIIGARSDEGQLIGFAAIVDKPHDFYRYLSLKKLKLAILATRYLIRHPRSLIKLSSRVTALRKRGTRQAIPGIELTSIGVCPMYNGQGVGSRLIDAIMTDPRYEQKSMIYLRTDVLKNEEVISFYNKNKFYILDIDYVGNRKMFILARNFEKK